MVLDGWKMRVEEVVGVSVVLEGLGDLVCG